MNLTIASSLIHAPGSVATSPLGRHVEEEGEADYGVDEEQHGALEPIGLAVANDVRDDERRHEHDDRLEVAEEEVEALAHAPADEDHHRDDEQRDLGGRAQRHTWLGLGSGLGLGLGFGLGLGLGSKSELGLGLGLGLGPHRRRGPSCPWPP